MTRDENGDTLLHLACRHNHAHIVQYLLSTGKVNPLAKNKNGETPMFNLITRTICLLHLAAYHGWMDILIDLITKYKFNTNCTDFSWIHSTTLCYQKQSPRGDKVPH